MEEVDRIIIHSLRDIGCDIGNDVSSLDVFSTELVIEAAARCLEIISPGSDIPRSLPINMAARFQVGASIASACKELGYSGDVGYQTFLYSNVTDLRRVFIFLIEKLPRESDKRAESEPDDPLSRLKADISRSTRASLNTRLTLKDVKTSPFLSLSLETGIVVPRDKLHLSRQEWSDYCTNTLEFLTEQVPSELLLPSAITLNSRGCVARNTHHTTDGKGEIRSYDTTKIYLKVITASKTSLKAYSALPLHRLATAVSPQKNLAREANLPRCNNQRWTSAFYFVYKNRRAPINLEL